MTIKTIIAAIALENGEQQVARRPIRLAADHGAKLVLAHAIESFPESDPNLSFPANEEAIANVLEAEAIASLKQMAEGATVQTEIEVECGKADQFIERLIRDHAADLLVIGPGKPQNLRERIFGSTADRVVRAGVCPIVVVKRAAARRTHKQPFTNKRLSEPVRPGSCALPGRSSAIRAIAPRPTRIVWSPSCAPCLNTETHESDITQFGNPECQLVLENEHVNITAAVYWEARQHDQTTRLPLLFEAGWTPGSD